MAEIEKAQDRLDVLKKQKELEENGIFDVDMENDPPTIELKPNKVDYLNKRLSNKVASFFAYKSATKFVDKMKNCGMLKIKEMIGLENLQDLQSGAVVTCNHFNPFDSFAMELMYRQSKIKNRKFYRVIREGNYTSMTGLFGFIMRHCNTLPLSSNRKTMIKFLRATNTLLQKGNLVLIYPEQAMWWNYRKPRPLKEGAFKFAVKNNVPVVPCFITMNDSDTIGPDGFAVQEYTIHIEKPIYKDESLSDSQNIKTMLQKNYDIWKNIYETTYNKKLTYDIKNKAEKVG